jgi:hypothetical protein
MGVVILPIRRKAAVSVMSSVHVLRSVLSPNECAMLCAHSGARTHHDDEGHGIKARKDVRLPLVALKILGKVDAVAIAPDRPIAIDEMMRVYRLAGGTGAVPEHTDDDFDGPNGSVARYSVLVCLNSGYAGGETLFRGIHLSDQLAPGDAYLFRHTVPHEGLAVESGVKFMLKTDLFVES